MRIRATTRIEGKPCAATIIDPIANGKANTVCENRMNFRILLKRSQNIFRGRTLAFFGRHSGPEPSVTQSRAMTVRDIAPRPLQEDENLISKLDDKEQVNQQPTQPGEKSTQLNHLKIRNGLVSADSCHAALVPVLERLRWASHSQGHDIPSGMFPSLHRKWGNARKRLPTLVRKIGYIANSKYVGMIRYAQVFLDDDPALAIGFSQLLRKRRSGIAGSPNHCTRADELVLELNSVWGNTEYLRANLHSEVIVEHRQNLWRRIEQNDARPLCLDLPKIVHKSSFCQL